MNANKSRYSFCLGLACLLLVSLSVSAQDGALVETGRAEKIAATPAATEKFKVVSYNMRWRGGADLAKLINLLREDKEIGGATIICLQEIDRNKKRAKNVNTARQIAAELGLYYAWAAPPTVGKDAEEETGVALLSRYPLTDVKRLVLPVPGPKGRRRVALCATASVGAQKIRVYSVHAEIRIKNAQRSEQLRAVIEEAKDYPTTIIAGDFNTYSRAAQVNAANLFLNSGYATPFPYDEATWRAFIVELKLDWLWLRGLQSEKYGIDRAVKMSGHWPLWAEVTSQRSKVEGQKSKE